ncbi:MAG: class I SAM-dependent methyltransferase [Candidatus Lokiarchaeota archaeon]|nr:class I SAM-dependent methyltransferase [Candidatus Lokiarchaeota archaeon]
MTRKKKLPRFPYDYLGNKANEYNSQIWMERNQKETSYRCINYLFDPKLGENIHQEYSEYMILDLGCGTGYSSEILVDFGFNVVAIDLLEDMLLKANEKKEEILNKEIVYELILANINKLPLRNNSFDFIVSVSAYNFITYGKKNNNEKIKVLNNTAIQLNRILKENGKIIIEFYPSNENELNLFLDSFKNNNFDGFVIKDKPQQKGGQTFLLLRKIQ